MDKQERERLVETMAKAMFDCYRGYNKETQEMLWKQAEYQLRSQAKRALSAIEGQIWSAIRAGLTYEREALLAAYSCGKYEEESIKLDSIARSMTERTLRDNIKGDGRHNKEKRDG